jgi:hypothetical protein
MSNKYYVLANGGAINFIKPENVLGTYTKDGQEFVKYSKKGYKVKEKPILGTSYFDALSTIAQMVVDGELKLESRDIYNNLCHEGVKYLTSKINEIKNCDYIPSKKKRGKIYE